MYAGLSVQGASSGAFLAINGWHYDTLIEWMSPPFPAAIC